MCSLLPSYAPSIPQFYFELCKSVYHTSSSSISCITTFLNPSDQVNVGLDVFININNRLILTKQEWNAIFTDDNVRDVSLFFKNGSTPSKPQQQAIAFINISGEAEKNFIVVYAGAQSMRLCNDEWWYLCQIMNCLNLRLQQLLRTKFYYENRFNFFRKRFKLSQVKTLYEASTLMDSIYDQTSLVDVEIKCFTLEYLFYSCLI